jgi:hypothetical protein
MHRYIGLTYISFVLFGGLVSAGCAERTEPSAEVVEEAREADAIGAFERPEALVANASRRLIDHISAADIGQTFGVPDERVPYADTYWPFVYGGTDWRWNPQGSDPRTPIEKYMAITAPHLTHYATAWEYRNHGRGFPGLANWHGHCPGWTAAALSNAPIRHPIFAGPDGRGGIAPCREGTVGCVRFEIGDVNALMAEIYLDASTSLIGGMCGAEASAIPRDRYGRILKEGCAGVNPGSLLIVASTLLRRYQIPFAIGAQNSSNTAEVWNQPAYRYHVYDFHRLTTTEAANLVARGSTTGPVSSYPWNPAARGFAFLDLAIHFVAETSPHISFTSGTSSTYAMRVAAVLELDADAANPYASILGGEYLDLPSSGADRLSVPPFLWVPRGPGPESVPLSASFRSDQHNPYLRPSLVRQLIILGQR